jgi:hypothetical protein
VITSGENFFIEISIAGSANLQPDDQFNWSCAEDASCNHAHFSVIKL